MGNSYSLFHSGKWSNLPHFAQLSEVLFQVLVHSYQIYSSRKMLRCDQAFNDTELAPKTQHNRMLSEMSLPHTLSRLSSVNMQKRQVICIRKSTARKRTLEPLRASKNAAFLLNQPRLAITNKATVALP